MPRKITLKFVSVQSLDCNDVKGFEKLGKSETLYGFGGHHHLRIRDISMEYGQPLIGHSLVTMQ